MDALRDLQLFTCVADGHSFSDAARKFGMSPASVSQAIAKLERELDTRLFFRSTRQISLTEEGRLFLAKSKEGLAKLDEAVDLLQEARKEAHGLVRITTSYFAFDENTLMPLLGEFSRRYPKVDLELHFENQPIDIVREGYDLSIRPYQSRSATSVSRRIAHFPLILVASPDYLARKGVPACVDDLAAHDWIHNLPPWSPMAKRELEVHQAGGGSQKLGAPERSRLMLTGHGYVAAASVLAGMGVAVLSSRIAVPYLRAGTMKVVLPDVRLSRDAEVYLEYPHRQFMARKVRVLLDFLFEQIPAQMRFADGADEWSRYV